MLKYKMYFEINKKFDNIIFRLITKPDNKQFVFLFLAFPPPPDGCAWIKLKVLMKTTVKMFLVYCRGNHIPLFCFQNVHCLLVVLSSK